MNLGGKNQTHLLFTADGEPIIDWRGQKSEIVDNAESTHHLLNGGTAAFRYPIVQYSQGRIAHIGQLFHRAGFCIE